MESSFPLCSNQTQTPYLSPYLHYPPVWNPYQYYFQSQGLQTYQQMHQSFSVNSQRSMVPPTYIPSSDENLMNYGENKVKKEGVCLEVFENHITDYHKSSKQKQLRRKQSTMKRESSSESFRPENGPQKKRKRRNLLRRERGLNYYWSSQESLNYFEFVAHNSHLFRLKYQDRTDVKINVEMSRKIGTRTTIQCHNHHQKMLKRHGGFQNLLQFVKIQIKKLGEELKGNSQAKDVEC